jgi:hypothetical protein
VLRFWTWLRDFANHRVRAAYMRKVGHDRKCPQCKTWTSEVDGARQVLDDGPMDQVMQCNRCRTWSRWGMETMIPYLREPWIVQTLPPTAQP